MAVWVHVLFTFNVHIRFCFLYTSSRPEMFCKKGVLRNFAKFTGKHLCQRLFFNKVADHATFLKKRPWLRCFMKIKKIYTKIKNIYEVIYEDIYEHIYED